MMKPKVGGQHPFFWSSMRVDGFFLECGATKIIPNLTGPWNLLTPLWMSLRRLQRYLKKPLWDLAFWQMAFGYPPPRRMLDITCLGSGIPTQTFIFQYCWEGGQPYIWLCLTQHLDIFGVEHLVGKTLLLNISSTWWFHFRVDKLTQGRWRQDEFVVVSLQKKQNISQFGACSHILWHSHYVVVSFLKVKVCCWVFFAFPKAPKENWRKNRGACQHSGDSETLWLTSTFFPLPGVGQHSHRVLPVFVFEHQHSWASSSRASATDQCLPYGHACSVGVLWGFYANETT